jgi:hypothetical protein
MPRQAATKDRPSPSTAPYTIPQDAQDPAIQHTDDPDAHAAVVDSNKRSFSCAVCRRLFSTSGHLARHVRIHTGERNHKCPFPGCETRCSRQDNLQQQYVILTRPSRDQFWASFPISCPRLYFTLLLMLFVMSFPFHAIRQTFMILATFHFL